jgi:predicted alpha/beta-fold hydrolase
MHGWEGSSDSLYNLTVGPLLNRHGFDTLRLNLRDHGESHHLNEELFHSCRLQEVVGAFQWIARQFPDRRINAVGFSLGGNFVLRVANRARAAGLDLEQAVAICPVLDPAQTMRALDQGPAIYERYFIHKWRRSLIKKRDAFPDKYRFDELASLKSLMHMTDHFVVNYTEYADLHSYLNGYAITEGRLDNIDVRTTVLVADDDPVIPIAGLQTMQFPESVQLYRSPAGGHCGFLQGPRLQTWLDQFVLRELEG